MSVANNFQYWKFCQYWQNCQCWQFSSASTGSSVLWACITQYLLSQNFVHNEKWIDWSILNVFLQKNISNKHFLKIGENRYSNNRNFDFPDYSNYLNSTLKLKYSILKLTFRDFQNSKTWISNNWLKSYRFLKTGKNHMFYINILCMPFPNLKIWSYTYIRMEFPIL